MYIGIDDDSKNFADACSYRYDEMSEEEAVKELKKYPASKDGESPGGGAPGEGS